MVSTMTLARGLVDSGKSHIHKLLHLLLLHARLQLALFICRESACG